MILLVTIALLSNLIIYNALGIHSLRVFLFLVILISFHIFICGILKEVWRMTLAYYVEWLFNIFQNYFPALFKAFDLDLNYFSYAFSVLFDISYAFIILNYSGYTEIKATEYNSLLNIFNECQDVCINIQCCHISYVSIDESVSNTFSSIAQYLMVKLSCTLIDFTVFCDIINDFLVKYVHSSHLLVDLRQELYILSCILDHCHWKRALFPKLTITLHLLTNFVFLWVYLTKIFFK